MQINNELHKLTYGYDAVWSRRFKGMYPSKVGLKTHAFKYVLKIVNQYWMPKLPKKSWEFLA